MLDDQTVAGPKLAYFAAQRVFSIFDDTLEPMFNVALEGASFLNAFNRDQARKLASGLPTPSDKLYGDACRWENDTASPNYRSCVGGDAKVGGTVATRYVPEE